MVAAAVLAVSAAALFVTKTLELVSFFEGKKPLLELTQKEAATGSTLGTFSLHKGHFYLVRLRSTARHRISVFLSSGGGTVGKMAVFDPRPDADLHLFTSVLKAGSDDPAGTIKLGGLPGEEAQQIVLREFSVSELSGWFYFARSLLRWAGLTGFTLAGIYLLWSVMRWMFLVVRNASAADDPRGNAELSGLPVRPRFWSVRMVGCWAVALLVIAGSFDVYFVRRQHSHLLLHPPLSSIGGWDGSFYYYWLRTLMVGGDVDIADDLLYCDSLPEDLRQVTARSIHSEIYVNLPRTRTGHIPNKYPIGWAVLEMPWYVAGDLYVQALNARGAKILYDGWLPVYQMFLVAGQVAYALAGLFLAYKILTRYLPNAFALCAVTLGWLGSPLSYYQTLDISMSHNVMFFATMAAYYFTMRLRESEPEWWNWFLVGCSCAFVILSRYQGAVLLIFPVVVCLQILFKKPGQWRGLVVGLIGGALPLGLQVFLWKRMYGTYLLYTYEGESFDWTHAHWFDVLFSPWHGWFNWHPAMFLGIVGYAIWVVRTPARTDAVCFTASLLAVYSVNAAWSCWWFGAAFGNRAFESCTFFAMIGLGYLLLRLSELRVAFHGMVMVLLLLGVWNMNMHEMVLHSRLNIGISLRWKTRVKDSYRMWWQEFHAR